jgi:hypothetical protein
VLVAAPRDPRACRATAGGAAGARRCFLACEGAMSAAHAAVAVDHAAPRPAYARARWAFGDAVLAAA